MNHISFRLKLTLIFIVTAILQGALIGGLSYYHSQDMVVKNKKREMSDTINRIDININVKVRYIMEILDNAADSELVRSACVPGWDQGERGIRRTYLDDYCSSLIRSIGEQMDISIINQSELLYTTSDTSALRPRDISGKVLETYYEAVGDRYHHAVWAGIMPALLTGREDERQVVTVVRAIMNSKEDRVLGLMVIELDPDMFSNLLLGNQGLFQYQYLFIVDQKGDVICSNPKVDKGWQEDIDDIFEQGTRRFDLKWRGKEYYVCGQYNGVTGWKSYSAIPSEGLFPQAKELSGSIWFVVVICTIGIAGAITVLVYAMLRPVKRLSAAMSQVQEGDFTVQVPNRRKDEIGELTDSFNYMVNKISTLIRQVYQEKLAQKNAEMQALQAQINPHFLYNTLDSVNWMLIDREEYDISDIIISLGSLMRYCIEDEHAFVPLDREAEYVICYLKIQKNRLEDKLEYQVDMDESVGAQKVPKLILQPLVENAITHGIESRKQKGRVTISIRDAGTEIQITVADNGAGMTPRQLRRLRAEPPDPEKEGHTGIGIRNVDRRIRLHYGDQYRIRIESKYGAGTSIYLRLPKTLPQKGGTAQHEANDCR